MARQLVHDRAAHADLIDIWLYSFETWGEAQAERYTAAIERGLGQLAEAPEKGKDRNALLPGYWSKHVERHVVFYTFDDHELRVRRVLHEVMDPSLHLGEG
jgi:toxin ParE1/3/4